MARYISLPLSFFWKELIHMTILHARDTGENFLPVSSKKGYLDL